MTDPEEPAPASAPTPVPAQTPQERAREAFAVIGRQARDTNLLRVDELEELASHATNEPLSEADRLTGQQVAHTLLGSAGTFGFTAATEPARRLENLFAEEFGPEEAEAVTALLARIRTALVGGPTEDDD